MSRAALWLGGVGIVLAALAVLGWIWSRSVIPPAVFSGQALACVAGAVAMQRRARREHARRLPDVSYGTVLLGLAATMMLNGIAFGVWLVLIGAGVAALGVVELFREIAAARRVVR